MKKIFLVLAILTTATIYSQDFYIPYKVGNKFGISDEKGNIRLKPQFDILEYVHNKTDLLVGYNLVGSEVLSSVIYKNKIIIKDKKYKNYYWAYGLLKAVEYTNPNYNPSFFRDDKKIEELNMLYTLKGKQVFTEPLPYIHIFLEWREVEKMEDLLIQTYDKNEKISLYLFNKKSGKITKTYFSEVEQIDMDRDFGQSWITYKTKDGKGKKITLSQTDRTIKSEIEDYIIEKKSNSYDRDFYNEPMPMTEGSFESTNIVEPANGAIIEVIRKVEQKSDFYWKPKKVDEIKFSTHKFDKSNRYVVKENGKYGYSYKENKKDTLLIPVKYDEILFIGSGFSSTFILRNDNKFSLYFWKKPIIEPFLDYLPLLERSNFVKDGFHLIRLYDKDNKFFCYANQDGKLYYSEK